MVLVDKNLKYLATIKSAEAEIQLKENQWQNDIRALEEKLRWEMSRKEEQNKQTEASWLTKKEDWMKKASGMEEEIQRLILQNVELQELAFMADKDKGQHEKEGGREAEEGDEGEEMAGEEREDGKREERQGGDEGEEGARKDGEEGEEEERREGKR
ncbi:golgin subfamily A member 6-like protein 7 [Seriola aureovittata]|uniref:golgin subfamily A member 6-like protein 7 n=1 Tax=Seriola aureovittata TaxID=2871759 RepID=UPI0024BE20FA|nr:golgin subfamily A member 6-like protein 7 [Seriola aureovittata]